LDWTIAEITKNNYKISDRFGRFHGYLICIRIRIVAGSGYGSVAVADPGIGYQNQYGSILICRVRIKNIDFREVIPVRNHEITEINLRYQDHLLFS